MQFSLQKITVRYKDFCALKGIDLNIPSGRTTVLLGTSGSGKSTILKVLTGIVSISQGNYAINGVASPKDRSGWEQLRLQLGYMTQKGGLFPHLTVLENLRLMADHLHWHSSRIQDRTEEMCELVKVPSSILLRYPQELSGGQQQRASLMRALFHDPKTLLLDEPMGALDPLTRYEVQKDLKAIFSALNKTVIFVTHDLMEASYFEDHISILNQGRLIQSGTFRELRDEPRCDQVKKFFQAFQRNPGEYDT